ncbi:hypothetical protein G6F16_005756 [Rhizopus arrhizus]|nr:hypothetical protein G6F18_005081 [Rhizopus arrhizus]KAG0837165.1 hypothetical protein G6F19_003844 [Rhizopus arrhizus]KAG0871627.1 hypothetical protein G6F16_005756 [Rhizopus arrhizus]KAG1114173.1 hypothetical protein G6F40_005360 [Rhizopus arrhizus]
MASQHNKPNGPVSFVGMNVNQVKLELAAQLSSQEQFVASLGATSQISKNAILKQLDVIKRELQDMDEYNQNDELPTDLRVRLEAVANELQHIKATKSSDTTPPLLPPPPPNHTSSSKQRSKYTNGSKRNPDIEFATEIGQGLLVEVRKLQNLIQEKDETIKYLETFRTENERHHETSQRYLRQREEVEERLKEENWNLEVANQELRAHLSESNQTIAKHNSEYARLIKQIKSQSEQIDIMKAQEEKNASLIEAMKARHEQETHQLRKHAANAQRENSQVQKQMEALNTELKICKAKLAIKMATASVRSEEPAEHIETVEKIDHESDHSTKETHLTPSASSMTTNRSQQMETETLKQSLAHAHRIISNLRSSAHKEKLEKFELKKMLSDSQETVEQLSKEITNINNSALAFSARTGGPKAVKKKHTKKRRGGVARQARGVSANVSSDSDRQSMKSSDSESEELEALDDSMDEEQQDLMDPHFSNGLGFGFGTPITPTPMKPLSSELEFKVQVIDIGINTDPIDLNVPKDSLSSVFLDAHSAAPINPISEAEPQLPTTFNRVDSSKSSEKTIMDRDVDIPLVLEQSPIENQVNVKEQVKHAVEKEMKIISIRAAAILPPQQMEILVRERVFVPMGETFLTDRALSSESAGPFVESDNSNTNSKTIASQHTATEIQTEADKITRKEANKLVEIAVKEALQKSQLDMQGSMIPKSEIKQLVAEVLEKQKSLLRANEQVEDMLTKSKIEQLIAEVLKSRNSSSTMVDQRDMIAKPEVEQLMIEIIEKQKESFKVDDPVQDMSFKSEVDKMIDEALNKQKSELRADDRVQEMISEALEKQKNTLKSNSQNEYMFTKEQVDQFVADELEKQRNSLKMNNITEDMIAKSEVDKLISEALKKQKNSLKTNNQLESVAIKPEVDQLITEALEKQRSTLATNYQAEEMIAKSEVDRLITEALEKQNASLKIKSPNEDVITKSKVDQLIAEALEKQKNALIAKDQVENIFTKAHVDQLITEALEKQRASLETIDRGEDMIAKSEVDRLITEALKKQKDELVADTEVEDRIAKSEVEQLITGVTEKAVVSEKEKIAKSIAEKEKAEEIINNMVAKSSVDKLISEAVEKALALEKQKNISNLDQAEQIDKDNEPMVAMSEVDKLVAEAIEKGIAIGEKKVYVATDCYNDVNSTTSRNKTAEREIVPQEQMSHSNEISTVQNKNVEEDLIPKSELDQLVAKATEKAIALEKEQAALTMISKEEAERMVTEASTKVLDEARLEMKQKMEQDMIPKSEVETMIEQAKKHVQIDLHAKFKEAEQESAKNLITKAEANTIALEAVEKERLNMISKEEAQGLVAQAIEKEHGKMLEHHQQTLEKALLEVETINKAEKESLNKRIESYKKECEDMNQRMKNMLTRESTDILIKRAVADALKTSEKKQQDVLAKMISKVDADILIQQAVSRALEQERKEAAAREEAEAIEMVSKAEAEALAKVAAADAMVKERQMQAEREKELISKDEANTMAQQAVQEAVEKEKLEHAEILAKERRAMKEKENNLITKEQAEAMAAEAVREALEKEIKAMAPHNTGNTVPSKHHREHPSSPVVLERSISTSRLAPSSSQATPTPSISTPPTTNKKNLRPSNSVTSLKQMPSDNNSSKKGIKAHRQTTENQRAYGTLRILESSTYGSRIIGSKNSLRNVGKQESATSVSTVSSEDGRQQSSVLLRSEEAFAMFSGGENMTNMEVISAITQTMIGEWMLKHTRRYVGGGISEKKHRRFFWVHPYTKTLYWSSIEPGVDGGESKAKSAFIESVVVVSSHNQQEASPMSLLIRTPRRDLKITAPTLERHEMWLKSLQYLLGRTNQTQQSSEEALTEENQYNNTMQSIKTYVLNRKSVFFMNRSCATTEEGSRKIAEIKFDPSDSVIKDSITFDNDQV